MTPPDRPARAHQDWAHQDWAHPGSACPVSGVRVHGVGIDVAEVARFDRLLARRGDAFVDRWFTADEAARCRAALTPARALAARFAVKEAAWKALHLADWGGAVPWPWVGVTMGRASDGAAAVTLTGPVAEAASRVGVTHLRASVSAVRHVVVAIVIADGGTSPHTLPPPPARTLG